MFFDMLQFLLLMVIFIAAYGIATQAMLYPNEWRGYEIFKGILYVPYFSIYGELFIGERNDWAFEDELSPGDGPDDDGCTADILVSDINASNVDYVSRHFF